MLFPHASGVNRKICQFKSNAATAYPQKNIYLYIQEVNNPVTVYIYFIHLEGNAI
jgi:hypothetical protein